ncbi:MAG TPA: 2-phospho-L-lactate transferase [Candidatus Dormibacteraeota bacterium]|nr:2-phospho-L-lactate transferase [Candidatus Dormibacteraeota bacterium]
MSARGGGRQTGVPGAPPPSGRPRVLVLAGGVGAARFLAGLVAVAPAAQLTVIGNTGDDFKVHGLHISPDLDTVSYSLAGLGDWERGWGLRGETWGAAEQFRRLGDDTWFQLGDRDLATHVWRTEQLRRGRPLSEVTRRLAERLGLGITLLPMTDQSVVTRVLTTDGQDLHIQEYLVRDRCQPEIKRIEYRGIERAQPAPGVREAIRSADLVVIAPSNPVISIGPILAVPGLRQELMAAPQVIAVSPIVAGQAVRGPAVPMLQSLGVVPSAAGVAALYADLISDLVMDQRDQELASEVAAQGVRPHLCDTLMVDQAARERLAAAVLAAASVRPVPSLESA